jgi:predicted enzyme related to lactoylglutathione lyase
MLSGPNFVIRYVRDLDQARQFYTDTLGFHVEDEPPGFVQFANTGGATYALGTAEASESVELWWYVDDADATHQALRARGVEIVAPPKDEPFGRSLAIKDAAGNTLHLLQLPTQPSS